MPTTIQVCMALLATTLGAAMPLNSIAQQPQVQKYAMGKALLHTQWTSKAGTKPWEDYPRPQLQHGEWENLNGMWTYMKPSHLREFTEQNLPAASDFDGRGREVLVPSCLESALSGIQEPLATVSWYRREFSIPQAWADFGAENYRFLLQFGAVDYEADVYLNGKRVGSHKGGYSSWSVDLTDSIKSEAKNEFLTTGVTLKVETNERTNTPVEITITKDGADVATASGRTNAQLTFKVTDPLLWTPDAPTLYTVTITAASDTIQSYTAFRTVSHGPVQNISRPLLNNNFIFQWGTLDQGYWPDGIYTPPSREAMRYDLIRLKELGFNTVRKHIKIEPELFYEDCDKLGLMVIQDLPSTNRDANLTPDQQNEWNRQSIEIIQQLRNHPSIVTWTLYNEGWGQGVGSPEIDLLNLVKATGATGLIDATSGWHDHGAGDFSSNHFYPGPRCGVTKIEEGAISKAWDQKRIAIQSEFGGLGTRPDDVNLWPDPAARATISETYVIYDTLSQWNTRSMQILGDLVTQIEQNACSGAIWTQTTDVEGEVNGLLSYDRKVFRPDVLLWQKIAERIYSAAKKRGMGKVGGWVRPVEGEKEGQGLITGAVVGEGGEVGGGEAEEVVVVDDGEGVDGEAEQNDDEVD